MGESWHNNHHAFPASAHFGLAWYRPDPGYWFIRTLERLGLASDVHVPAEARIRDFNRPR
jgi:stearoyl-CoA desaturase (delta-9 desaturase)